jgi:hypothetical protein
MEEYGRLEDNIKIDLKITVNDVVEWMEVARDREY